jgi:hypothetical protein
MEIIQQAAALADHDQKTAAGAVVFDIFLQMFGQVVDAFCQKSDLHVGGPCVALVQSKPCYRLSFFHIQSINYSIKGPTVDSNVRPVKAFFWNTIAKENAPLRVCEFAEHLCNEWLRGGLCFEPRLLRGLHKLDSPLAHISPCNRAGHFLRKLATYAKIS